MTTPKYKKPNPDELTPGEIKMRKLWSKHNALFFSLIISTFVFGIMALAFDYAIGS